LVACIFRDRLVKVPWSEVEHVTGRITLKKAGASYGLLETERRFEAIVKRVPFA
jgi:hypothetical protein